jgi:outer membrane protein assembly factor BamA
VLIRGNFRTSERIIRDEISLSPGEALNLVALSDAKQNLRKLGTFSGVELQPLDTGRTSTTTWMLADVEERDQRSFAAVASFRTDELFAIGVDARDNNLFGHAINLDLSVRYANADQHLTSFRIGLADRFTARMTTPRPFGAPLDVSYSALYDFEDKPIYRLRDVTVAIEAHRLLIHRTDCSVCPNLLGSLFYRLSSTSLVVNDVAAPATTGESVRVLQVVTIPNETIGSVGPRIAFDRLDSTFDPRSGFNGNVALELADPVLAGPLNGSPPFWRFIGLVDVFADLGTPPTHRLSSKFTLGGAVVAAVGLRYGVAHPLTSHQVVPTSQTFAYGGDLSVRGTQEKASVVAFLGANYLATVNIELRYYFLNTFIGEFQIAAISDTGMVSYHLRQLASSPTITAGVCLRYITPVGPISFAYAKALVAPSQIVSADPSAIPPNGRFHLTFGYAF